MDDGIDPLQRLLNGMTITKVAALKLHLVVQIRRPFPFAVNLLDQAVEHTHLVPPPQQFATDGAADETGAARDKYFLHGQSPVMSVQIVRAIIAPQELRRWQKEHLLLPTSSTKLTHLNGM
ncbi:hypothetical protein K663_04890 [Sphingobium sp. MI1205]|nr:hypothetical protein K663_04890 [Sphingobium sp. MI1205]